MSIAVLINPPFIDPTCPPHFAAYLKGAAAAAGIFDIEFLDLNLELHNFVFTEKFFKETVENCRITQLEIEKKNHLSVLDRVKYRIALSAQGIHFNFLKRAESILRDKNDFYDFGLYRGSVEFIMRYFSLIGITDVPGLFAFGDLNIGRYFDISRSEDISGSLALDLITSPFKELLSNFVNGFEDSPPQYFALSCNYQSQVHMTAYLCKVLADKYPGSKIVVGGTELTDIYKHAASEDVVRQVFGEQTLLVIGEGESAFVELLQGSRRKGKLEGQRHPNIVVPGLPKVRTAAFENLNSIGQPYYAIYTDKKYFAPDLVLMYSPTRGCYWNRCTFCDYGLNFGSPTSPSRQRTIELAREDLSQIAQITPYVYLAVDAISPAYLRKLSEIICVSGIKIHWSAEIRLETRASGKVSAEVLKDGGCVALSFGLESGSQRILDLIDKGVCIDKVAGLLSELSTYGIHSQMMAFIGFPTESLSEAVETFRYLQSTETYWTFAAVGDFTLTPGAIVVRETERFQISELVPSPGDINRSFKWIDFSGTLTDGGRNIDARSSYIPSNNHLFSRPFLGGIDTAHSLLYFSTYQGRAALLNALDGPIFALACDSYCLSAFADILDFPTPADLERDGSTLKNYLDRLHRETWTSVLNECPVVIRPSGNIYIDCFKEKLSDDHRWLIDMLI